MNLITETWVLCFGLLWWVLFLKIKLTATSTTESVSLLLYLKSIFCFTTKVFFANLQFSKLSIDSLLCSPLYLFQCFFFVSLIFYLSLFLQPFFPSSFQHFSPLFLSLSLFLCSLLCTLALSPLFASFCFLLRLSFTYSSILFFLSFFLPLFFQLFLYISDFRFLLCHCSFLPLYVFLFSFILRPSFQGLPWNV